MKKALWRMRPFPDLRTYSDFYGKKKCKAEEKSMNVFFDKEKKNFDISFLGILKKDFFFFFGMYMRCGWMIYSTAKLELGWLRRGERGI